MGRNTSQHPGAARVCEKSHFLLRRNWYNLLKQQFSQLYHETLNTITLLLETHSKKFITA